jgi:O-antigen/teichoic acid export membrane protein
MLKIVASPFAVGVGARLIGQLIAFATVILAARYLTLADFGSYAVAWAVTVIATSFVFSGLHQACLRSRDIEADGDTLFWLMLGVGACGLVIMLGIGLLAGGSGSGTGRVFLGLSVIPLASAPVAWLEALLMRAGRARAAAAHVAVAESLGLCVAAATLEAGLGTMALVAARHAVVLAGLLMLLGLVRRRPRRRFRSERLREIRATVTPLWVTTSLAMFSNYGADLVLGAFLSPAAVGAYRSGARITMTVADLIVQPLGKLSWARFTRHEKDADPQAIARAWLENMAAAALLFWPIACGLALLAAPLVETVFGPAWLPAAPVVALLAVSRSLRLFSALLEPALISTGHAATQQRIRLCSAVVLLLLLVAWGRAGATEAALAQIGTALFLAVMAVPAQARALGIGARSLVRCFLPGAGMALACAVTILLTEGMRAALPGAQGLVATVALLGLLWLAGLAIALRSGRLVLPTP